jgi:hypothetical protein
VAKVAQDIIDSGFEEYNNMNNNMNMETPDRAIMTGEVRNLLLKPSQLSER